MRRTPARTAPVATLPSRSNGRRCAACYRACLIVAVRHQRPDLILVPLRAGYAQPS